MIVDLTENVFAEQIPVELPYVLYGDTSQATRDAMGLLIKHKIPYQLSLYHTLIWLPALDTPWGELLRGVVGIRRFAENKSQEDNNVSH